MKNYLVGLTFLISAISAYAVEPSQTLELRHGESAQVVITNCEAGEKPTFSSRNDTIIANCEPTVCHISYDGIQNRYKSDSKRTYNRIYIPLEETQLQVELNGRAAAVAKGQELVASGKCSDYSVNWFGDSRKH